jgi:hypothetical protein
MLRDARPNPTCDNAPTTIFESPSAISGVGAAQERHPVLTANSLAEHRTPGSQERDPPERPEDRARQPNPSVGAVERTDTSIRDFAHTQGFRLAAGYDTLAEFLRAADEIGRRR